MSGTTDTNWKSFGPLDNGRLITPGEWLAPAIPSDYDDLYKGSNVEDLTARELKIPDGAREDGIDAVRGKRYKWLFCTVLGAVTIKGAIQGWLFEHGILNKRVTVGQFDKYWYWGRPPTTGGEIKNVATMHGRAIDLWLWDATPPIVTESKVKTTKIPKIIWLPYFCWRYVYIRIADRIAGILKTNRRRL